MEYTELLEIYHSTFFPEGLPYDKKTELIHLLALLVSSLRKKDPERQVLEIFDKINKNDLMSSEIIRSTFVIPIALEVDSLLHPRSPFPFKPNNYGCKNGEEIIARINKILDSEYLPF